MTSDQPPAEPTPARMHGLWGVMKSAAAAPPEGSPPPPDSNVDAEPVTPTAAAPALSVPEHSRGRSLWDVMQGAASGEPSPEESSADELDEPIDTVLAESLTEIEESVEETVPEAVASRLEIAELPVARALPRVHRSRADWWAVAWGLLAWPLVACAFEPGVIPSLPYSACAFVALGLAAGVFLRPEAWGWPQARAGCGGLLAAGVLWFGPFVMGPMGNAYRSRMSVQSTQLHLEQIGRGLQRHHDEHGHYPEGGTSLIGADRVRRGGHGWMTRLLPYIDQAAVYGQIQLDLPYDDPANRKALGTPIETYYAAGGDRRTVANGFAVAHFSGVGGSLIAASGEELPAGIFDPRRPIRQREILDGLSQTWIVGEVPGGYPPWGDPENWRTVSKGINRDVRGFGNAAGTGAMLLFADGSVRFFGNQTDVNLLKKLSTRDARDLVVVE